MELRRQRCTLMSKAILLCALMIAAAFAGPAAAQFATWDSLAPAVEPYDDPFVEMPFEQKDALRVILRADMAAAAGQLDDAMAAAAAEARRKAEAAGLDVEWLFAQREAVMERRREADLGVTTTHLDRRVMMDGYVLPLRAEDGRVVEFLLVPWVGACIHTPPPAPNQIVHVAYPTGFEPGSMFTPIRLTGRLTHRPAEFDLFLVDGSRPVAVSYAMEDAAIGGTPGEIVAATSATADLPWWAAAQARITEIFTGAMRGMEQGRSVGTVGLALLVAFAYGALHTLGPGHGKAVVVSYFVGSGGSLRRGVVMGVRIAAMHVLSAVVVVFLLDFAVRQATGAAPADYRMIRLGSYALIVAIGATMLWRAIAATRAGRKTALECGGHDHDPAGHGHPHGHHDDLVHPHGHRTHRHPHAHAHAGCAACAAANAGSQGGGWIAAAVGMVPCTGALIVMLFGLANNLVVPAVMMVVAISAGMALAMSAIGIAAILGRNWAEARMATSPEQRFRFESGTRIAAAACVLAIGTLLFTSTLVQQPGTEGQRQASVGGEMSVVR